MTYQNDIELLDERLKLYSTYIVSNALVSRANQFFNVPDERYRFVWSINRKTLIQEVDNDDQLDLQPSSDMDTKPFGQLYDYKSKRQAINIIGVVISKLPREFIVTNRTGQQKANDFVIVDEELKPIIFTMWGNFTVYQGVEIDKELQSGDYPVVLGRRITVTPYQGISLSTRMDSGVEVNPFGKRADALKEWAKTNSLVIERLIVEKAHNNAVSEMASPLDQQISPISDLKKSFDQSKGVWVKSKITLIDNGNPTYYIGCNNCDKKVNCNDEGIKFQCMFCGHANAVSIKRYRLIVELFDGTDRIQATMFNRLVDKLFSLTETENEKDSFDFQKLQKKLDTPTFAVELRSQTQDRGGMTSVYTISSICEDISTSSITGTKKKLAFGESSNPVEDSTNLPPSNVDNNYAREKRPRIE